MSAILLIALPLLVDHVAPSAIAKASPIDEFEQRALATGNPLVDLPALHRFTPGLYSRTVKMLKGVIYTSRLHLTRHQFVISTGRVTVFHDDGSQRTLSAPHVGITEPGTRRAILVHEDCVWTTFHPTEETDLEKIEAQLVAPRPEHLRERHCLQPSVTAKELST